MNGGACGSGGEPGFIVIGNPENRRVGLFQQALAGLGRQPAKVVSYLELLERPERLDELPEGPALVRIDSPGESFAVERLLLRAGYERARAAGVSTIGPEQALRLQYERGRILAPTQAHLGFASLLERIGQVAVAKTCWTLLARPATIVELFDKRRCWQRHQQAGVPVPPALHDVETPEQLRGEMRARGWGSVFVKLACGSSASCLAVLHHRPHLEFLMTTIERTAGGWYNSLRLQRVERRREVDEVLGFLLREGAQIEQQLPKARLDRSRFDCRVLLVEGEPAFTVVRQSRHPITNLHLGGWRGELPALERAAPPAALAAAYDSCRAVAALHASFQLGVDLMFTPGFGEHVVIEANAFGDLLPRLTRRGLSVYAWQIERALARWSG